MAQTPSHDPIVDDDTGAHQKTGLDSLLSWVKAIAIFGVVGFLTMILAVVAVRIEASNRDNDRQADRTEARAASCAQDNVRIDQHNDLALATGRVQEEINVILAFSTAVPEGAVLTDEQQARLDAFLAVIDEERSKVEAALATTIVERRDCSREGIAEYLSTTTTTGP